MYNFIDVNEAPGSNVLPSEAMQFNGIYLENEIPGYRTLSVTGRELMDVEVTDETRVYDGSTFISKRYPSRTIEVAYQLISKNDDEFRSNFNKLNSLLEGTQVKVIFNDEPDKYFIGTKSSNNDVEKGRYSVTGTISIYCTCPYKFSTVQKEFTASANSDGILEATVTNSGNVPVSIDYEITHNADSGYIGIINDQGTMQFGKYEELDGEDYIDSEQLLSISDFFSASDDTTGTEYMHPSYGVSGTLKTSSWWGNNFLSLGTQGTVTGGLNGGMRTLTIPADSSGNVGAKNFYSYFHVLQYAGLMGQTGEMSLSFLDKDNKLIAGLNWCKSDASGNTGYYELWSMGKVLKKYTYQTNHIRTQNPWYWNWGHCDLRKEGSKLTFFYWGGYPSYIIPEVEDLICTKVQFSVKEFKGKTGNKFMTNLGMNQFQFTKTNVDKWKDTPNRYSSGDVSKIDGESSKYYLNDMYTPQDEVLGTKYFKANPGDNTIQFATSEWTTTAPTVTVKIREAWL